MDSSETNTDSLSYRSHRLLLSIDVSVDDGVLNWRYRSIAGDWKERMPLSKLLPCPTITINRSSFWRAASFAFVTPIVVGFVLLWLDAYGSIAIAAAVVAFFVVSHRIVPYIGGPIEWAVFNTTLADKTIFFFRNSNDAEFDAFVDSLEQAIIKRIAAEHRNADEAEP